MKQILLGAITAALLVMPLASCAQRPPMPKVEKKYSDGELPLPADYKSWPKFLSDVQRPDSKQVRDLYINPIGNSAKMGEEFPYGTITVMEIYKAQEAADGTPLKGPDGKLVKGEKGLDVGDRVKVKLLSVDIDRGFIDFARQHR